MIMETLTVVDTMGALIQTVCSWSPEVLVEAMHLATISGDE